jgi:hypothetical protein
VSTALTVVTVMLLVLTAIGVHSLQAWLERWDHDRHGED